VEVVLTSDPGELEGAFDHPERGIAEAVHDPVTQRTVVGADAHGAAQFLAELDERGEFLFDSFEFSEVLVVGVFLDGKFFGIGVIAWV